MPGVDDTAIGAESCQHSRVEWPFVAEMAVRFRKLGVARVGVRGWRRMRLRMRGGIIVEIGEVYREGKEGRGKKYCVIEDEC